MEFESPRQLFTVVVDFVVHHCSLTLGDRQDTLWVVMLSRKSIGSYSNLYLHNGNISRCESDQRVSLRGI